METPPEKQTNLCVYSRAGQPRTGDAAFADLLESIVGRDNIYRGKAPI
jgi:hypothetical protein